MIGMYILTSLSKSKGNTTLKCSIMCMDVCFIPFCFSHYLLICGPFSSVTRCSGRANRKVGIDSDY